MSMTLEEIKNLVQIKYNGEYKVLEERTVKSKTGKSQRRELKISHSCGNVYWLQSNRVIGKQFQQCPYCNKKKSKITNDNFKQKVFDLVGDEYTVIGDYVNNYTKVKLRHNKCGFIIEMMPKHFLNDGHRCRACAMKNRYNKTFINDLAMMSNNQLYAIDHYSGAFNFITIKCATCDSVFKTTPHSIYSQYRKYGNIRCRLCSHNTSVGEKHLIEIFNKYNIKYIYNKSLPGCNHKKPLRFDFIIGDENNPLACIEFDGEQHYLDKSLWIGESEMELIHIRDNIKNKYCADNNIPLLRTREKIKSKLEKEVIKFLNENELL